MKDLQEKEASLMKERDLALAKVDEDFHAAAAMKKAAGAQAAPEPPDDAQGKTANKIQRNKRLTREEACMNNRMLRLLKC